MKTGRGFCTDVLNLPVIMILVALLTYLVKQLRHHVRLKKFLRLGYSILSMLRE